MVAAGLGRSPLDQWAVIAFSATFCKATIGFKFSLQESKYQVSMLLKVLNVCFLCEMCIKRPLTSHEPKPRCGLYWRSFGSEPAATRMGSRGHGGRFLLWVQKQPSGISANTDVLEAWVMLDEPRPYWNNLLYWKVNSFYSVVLRRGSVAGLAFLIDWNF